MLAHLSADTMEATIVGTADAADKEWRLSGEKIFWKKKISKYQRRRQNLFVWIANAAASIDEDYRSRMPIEEL